MYIPHSRLYKPRIDIIPTLLEPGEIALAMLQIGVSNKVLTNKRLLFLDLLDSKVKEYLLLENIASFSFATSMGLPRIDAVLKSGGVIKIGTLDASWLEDVKPIFESALQDLIQISDATSEKSADISASEPYGESLESDKIAPSQSAVRTNSTKAFPAWLQHSIHSHKSEDEEILMVITEPYTSHQGAVLVFADRCMIVKGGFWGGLMSGSLGGERAATFYFTQITGVEYNSGMMNGVLEILTASYQASANKDFWKGTTRSRNADSNDPWTLSNTLPLTKEGYKTARSLIDELKKMISESQTLRPSSSVTRESSIVEELAKLAELKTQGVVTEQEFQSLKKKLLGS